MFVVLGCVTVVLGVATFFLIPDSPSTANFLTNPEKARIAQHVAPGTTGAVSSKFNLKQLADALTDPQLLLLSLMTILVRVYESSNLVTALTLYDSPAYPPVLSPHIQQRLLGTSGTRQRLLRFLTFPLESSQSPAPS